MSKPSSRRRKRIDEDDEEMDMLAPDMEMDESTLWDEENNDEEKRPSKKKRSLIADVLDEDLSEGSDVDVDVDESDSEDAAENAEIDKYGPEGWGDETETARLNEMSELDREQILHERQTKWNEREERRAARAEMRAAKKGKKVLGKGKKGAAAAMKPLGSEAESKQRSRASDAKLSMQDALKDLLARKTRKMQSQVTTMVEEEEEEEEDEEEEEESDEDLVDAATARRRRKGRAKSRRSTRGYTEDEHLTDVADANAAALELDEADERPEIRTPLQYQHVKNIQLRRVGLEKVIDEPYFNDLVTGMFVRVNLGTRDDGTAGYKLCQVVGVQEYRTRYKFGTPPREIKVGLLLKYGKAERVFPCQLISNTSVTAEEFDKWQHQMEVDGLEPPSAEDAMRLRKKAMTIRQTFQYTPEVIAKLLEEKRTTGRVSCHINTTAERARLQSEFLAARDKGDVEAMKAAQGRLDELDEIDLTTRTSRAKARMESKGASGLSVDQIAAINQRHIEQNTADMERMLRIQREKKAKQQEEAMRIFKETGEAPEIARDAFQRKETRPSMDYVTAEQLAEQQAKRKAAQEKKKREEEERKKRIEMEMQQKKNKKSMLEHFEEVEPVPPMTPTAGALTTAEPSPTPSPPAFVPISTPTVTALPPPHPRTLHLPTLPTVTDKILTLLQQKHREVDPLHIDERATHPTTTLPAVLGRFVDASGGGGGVFELSDDLRPYTQPPSGRALTIEEYIKRRQQMGQEV